MSRVHGAGCMGAHTNIPRWVVRCSLLFKTQVYAIVPFWNRLSTEHLWYDNCMLDNGCTEISMGCTGHCCQPTYHTVFVLASASSASLACRWIAEVSAGAAQPQAGLLADHFRDLRREVTLHRAWIRNGMSFGCSAVLACCRAGDGLVVASMMAGNRHGS